MACQSCAHWRRFGTIHGDCPHLGRTTAWTRCHHYTNKLADPNAERYDLVRDEDGYILPKLRATCSK